jgi:hypothetical protein
MRRIAGLLLFCCVLLPASAAHAEIEVLRAGFAASLSRNGEPRRPIESLRIPSAAYYYVKVKGAQQWRRYAAQIEILDGAQRVVARHAFETLAMGTEHVVWWGFSPKNSDAPGNWTFTLQLEGRIVARTRVHAGPDGGAIKTARYEQLVIPIAALALLGMLVYLTYGLVAARGAAVAAAPPARGIGDAALFVLVVANLMPLGLAYFGYANAADLLFIYWIENLVIACYAILRIATARSLERGSAKWIAILGFFLLFVMFVFLHGGVLLHFAREQSNLIELEAARRRSGPRDLFDYVPAPFVLATAALIVSHGVSFVQNYLKRGEFLVTTLRAEVARPLDRVWAMHTAGVLAGLYAAREGSSLIMLVLLVAIKTALDVHAHVRSHVRVRREPRSEPRPASGPMPWDARSIRHGRFTLRLPEGWQFTQADWGRAAAVGPANQALQFSYPVRAQPGLTPRDAPKLLELMGMLVKHDAGFNSAPSQMTLPNGVLWTEASEVKGADQQFVVYLLKLEEEATTQICLRTSVPVSSGALGRERLETLRGVLRNVEWN